MKNPLDSASVYGILRFAQDDTVGEGLRAFPWAGFCPRPTSLITQQRYKYLQFCFQTHLQDRKYGNRTYKRLRSDSDRV